MSNHSRTTKQPVPPSYPQPTRAQTAAMALVAVLVSSTLLGGLLSMFEVRSEATAMARASVKPQPSAGGLVVRKGYPGSRG